MLILLILSLILLAAVLYAQYRRSRALRRAARDLKEARIAPGTRLRLYSPDDKLEELLSQINGLLEDKERETRVLRSREESLRRQIANVSHDLRTPLTSILGYLQLMGREDISPEEYRHCLEIVEGRAKVLQDLITSFYDLSRIEGGEYPLELQSVDLRRSLEPLLAGFYEDFEQAGFQVTVELMESPPAVSADPGAVTRILTNLIGNALKHGSKTLDIRLYQEGQTLVTAFSNDAPELTQEDLPRVFERFYTADQMRTGQNTGLGLAIVKALSEQMGRHRLRGFEGRGVYRGRAVEIMKKQGIRPAKMPPFSRRAAEKSSALAERLAVQGIQGFDPIRGGLLSPRAPRNNSGGYVLTEVFDNLKKAGHPPWNRSFIWSSCAFFMFTGLQPARSPGRSHGQHAQKPGDPVLRCLLQEADSQKQGGQGGGQYCAKPGLRISPR